jgi:hypothetical protein
LPSLAEEEEAAENQNFDSDFTIIKKIVLFQLESFARTYSLICSSF